ncbi:MAG: ArsA-related P-loop ATPase [Myxococcota bacterium]
MAANVRRSLLTRRLVIVTGKGGTGKTTVAASLAVAAAAENLRVLVAEVGRDEQIQRLLAPGTPPVGHAGRTILPGITAMRIDPYEALAEYLSLQIGIRALVESVLRNRSFRQLMSASPGWRELITLGKIWHLEQSLGADGSPLYDLIVVDAPSTGHGVTFLEVPRVVVSAVRSGPLHHHSEAVEALLEDPERTALLPVTLAEELPTRETAQLVARLRQDLDIAVDRVVVNGVVPAAVPPSVGPLGEILGRLPPETPLGRLPAPPVLGECVATLQARHELNRSFVREIAEVTGLPLVLLPQLPRGIEGLSSIEALAGPLTAPPESDPP